MTQQAIALDVMGGDHAPGVVLDGALAAIAIDGDQALPPERILLVGDEDQIRAGLEERGGDPGFPIQHASQVVEMGEKPGQALRAKPDSSIAVGIGAVKRGAAGAFVSMGNTGAVVGASTLGLRTLAGVRRPGIAVTLELTGRPLTILDMGANVAPKAQHLAQYGTMGAILQRDCMGVENPKVGLMNIGEEASKGNDLLREAYGLLEAGATDGQGYRFVGNVEPGDLFQTAEGVVVTDGFTGNVVLKLMESVAAFMFQRIHKEIAAHEVTWGPEALGNVKRQIDYSEYGGALLLGVAGVVVIGHGRSDGRAVANALGLAVRALDRNVNGDIVRGLESAART
ncbi:MAG: phosphate acyltransferase PlsX [Chloroflexi bacterium]|nr:phosphate acyltransferase PlsX [Chloroflexota bacterium]